jgi:hypothetical protein
MRLLHRVPHAQPLCLFIAQQVAALRLLALDHHIDRVTRVQLRLPGVIDNLLDGDQPLGLHAHIHDHMLVGELDDRAGHDRRIVESLSSSFGRLLAIERLERRGKVFHARDAARARLPGRALRQRPREQFRPAMPPKKLRGGWWFLPSAQTAPSALPASGFPVRCSEDCSRFVQD